MQSKVRNEILKIPDIKAVRSLSRLLGKLHLKCCYRTYNEIIPQYDLHNTMIGHLTVEKEIWGYGLAESKAFVEGWFNYQTLNGTNIEPLQMNNMIQKIKRTRQALLLLNKLGLSSPDAGLAICKRFVERRRN